MPSVLLPQPADFELTLPDSAVTLPDFDLTSDDFDLTSDDFDLTLHDFGVTLSPKSVTLKPHPVHYQYFIEVMTSKGGRGLIGPKTTALTTKTMLSGVPLHFVAI